MRQTADRTTFVPLSLRLRQLLGVRLTLIVSLTCAASCPAQSPATLPDAPPPSTLRTADLRLPLRPEALPPPVAAAASTAAFQTQSYSPSDPTTSAQDDADKLGSTNVPMDSWVYPALERLAALGLIPSQSIAIRPWTRQECLRQISEADDLVDLPGATASIQTEANRLLADLHTELDNEARADHTATLEWVYARPGTIAGPALADSYHFGQTSWNDFGRPLGRGTSLIAGVSARATSGRFFLYGREEFQHGPGNPGYTPAVNQLISNLDTIPNVGDPPIQPFLGNAAFNRARPIEYYAGIAAAGNSLSFGKQELFWGPTTMGPLAFSSNAEPTYNLRYVSTRPHPVPFVPFITYRFDIVFGKLSGHKYPARPYYNGQKADFNLGENLEISFTRWSIFFGQGHPMTFGNFDRNLFSFNSTGSYVGNGSSFFGDPLDPGDRKSNFDFRYRLPFLRRIVTLYADAYSDDDPSPIDAPRRAFWNPGIYLARLPWLPHMDLRVEAASSEGLFKDFGGQHFLWNGQYLDANTNKGFLLGNAVGRDGRAIEANSSYWFSSRTRVEAGYRQNKGGTLFLPGGSTITDGFVNASYGISRHWQAQFFAQYERFLIPSYLPGSHHNTSGWIDITWNPEIHLPLHKQR
jgi:Capsule assembly protein Wzi